MLWPLLVCALRAWLRLLVAVGRFQTRTSTTYRTYIEDFLIFHFGLIIPHSRIKHYSRINRSFSFSNFIPITASKREKWRQTCPMKNQSRKSTHQIPNCRHQTTSHKTQGRRPEWTWTEPIADSFQTIDTNLTLALFDWRASSSFCFHRGIRLQ